MMNRMHRLWVAAVALGLAGAALAADVIGTGVVKAVDARAGALVIAHDPIPALGWPAMTMPFKVSDPKLLDPAVAGKKVRFTLPEGGAALISALTVLP
ncbi:MAG: copper-binding protein [Gammaproteobacteria bacterium]|nr:copper-binding protein [Gammaproteobacteria bacterium]